MNRNMMTDLMVSDGQIAGALGVGTRTGDIYFFRTKAVVLSSGRANRLTRNAMGVNFNLNLPPHLSGDGKVMALQAGVDIVNMEFLEPRNFGKGVNQPSSGFPRNTFQPAGAIVDPLSVERGKERGLDAKAYLGNNDAFHFFEGIDQLLITGPTKTNVMDVRIILVK